MKKASIFQIIILCVFGALAVGGVMVFALFVNGTENNTIGPVTIWGTFNERQIESVLGFIAEADESLKQVTYVERDSASFQETLTQALASGQGPDLYFIRQDYAFSDKNKVVLFPESVISASAFKNIFVDSALPFSTPEGAIALPLVADPLVLYWNRDLLAAGGYANAPRYWDELFDMARIITGCHVGGSTRESGVSGCDRDTLTIKKATVALGTYQNIDSAKDILSAIIMQADGSITRRDESGELVSALVNRSGSGSAPTETALRFYTEFSDPAKEDYSWNSALPNSRVAFSAGDLALYVGYASEASVITGANPNLNIGVAPLPQVRNGGSVVTFARVYGLAMTRTGKNQAGGMTVALKLAQPSASEAFAQALGISSVRRDVLTQGGQGMFGLFASSTIVSRSWTDPSPQKTDSIFRAMIEGVVTGSVRLTEAVSRADQEIKTALEL